MNRVKTQQIDRSASPSDSVFGGSISAIDRRPIPAITLPAQPSIFNADSEGSQQLDALYPLSSIHRYLHDHLRPSGIDRSLLTPSHFQAELVSCRHLIRQLALNRRSGSRRIGRLARLLDEQDALCRLAQLYASALLQG